MTDYLFPIGTILLALYFFFRLKTQKQNQVLNAFSAGAFSVIAIYKVAKLLAKIVSS